MILIADSGSSKADWCFVKAQGASITITSIGINPNLHSIAEMTAVVEGACPPLIANAKVSEIYYYGTGIWDATRGNKLRSILTQCYPNAKVEVHHDLLGAARAACGNAPGIACILGTGSNSCLYNGKSVVDNVTNLGWLIGDEGSGVDLGKRLLRAFSYRELPEDDAQAFLEQTGYNRQTIGDGLYGSGSANRFLASFSPFIHDNLHRPAIRALVEEAFTEFLRKHVSKYHQAQQHQVNFIGSIAFHYSEILREVCQREGFTCGSINKKPIDALVAFHTIRHDTPA